jgi:glycosyltransferase involved in cell wall biosynthesis
MALLSALIGGALLLPFRHYALSRHLGELENLAVAARRRPAPDMSAPAAYLKPDIIAGLQAGGSVGHVAGVLNHLGHYTAPPVFFAVDPLPTLDPCLTTHLIRPPANNGPDLPGFRALRFSRHFAAEVWRGLRQTRPAFLYQRHALDNWSGAELALRHNLPFVLEYNGSEVWVAKNWGSRARHEALSWRVENLCLRAADLVVAVSASLGDELADRGVERRRILVNPNGVDTDIYRPEVDGSAVRTRHTLQGKLVIGFIGTFGKWHGAEKMAEACTALFARRPDLAAKTRVLYIGDGATRPAAEAVFQQAGLPGLAVFTGIIPQAQGPEHLAACDILVAPHVPNSDGSRFFGSPTKLFEYMAMGKAIAASALEQLDEVLEDGITALKAQPGDAGDLSRALERLAYDPDLRTRLGQAARCRAVEKHTWRAHTGRIIAALARQWD